jgi:hypothetical protein
MAGGRVASLAVAAALAGCADDPIGRSARPAIYGADDRRDVYQVSEEPWLTLARRSVASLLRIEHWSLCEGAPAPREDAPTAQAWHELCDGVRFAEQPIVSRCSATLIDRDLIITASHCIVDDAECAATAFGFGLYYEEEGELRDLDQADLYRCAEVVARPDKDIVIVRTDRPVAEAYDPVPFATELPAIGSPVALIGFPSYIPMKVSAGCTVRDQLDEVSRLDCDAMRGNSGSGAFSEAGELFGVLFLATGDYRPQGDCRVPIGYTQDGQLVDAGATAPLFVHTVDPRIGLEALCAGDAPTELCGRPAACGDGACTGAETAADCAADCPAPSCGDGRCDLPGEPGGCPADCEPLGCGASSPDAGPVGPDAGHPPAGDEDSGGCRVGGRSGGGVAWLLLVAIAIARRRVLLLAGLAACTGEITGPAGSDPAPDADPLEPAPDARPGEIPLDAATPTFAFHPRDEWQSGAEPVTGPSADLLTLRYITIHYNGSSADLDGDDGVYQDADYAELLRAMQSSYLSSRGYSLGYNSGIAPNGDEWEIRGLDIRSAANGCTEVNLPGYAIQVTVPEIDAPPTAEQILGVRQAVARVRAAAAAAGNLDPLELNGHRDVRPLCGTGGTACPGEPLAGLLAAGELEP